VRTHTRPHSGRWWRLLGLGLVTASLLLGPAAPAGAHPLGNFTVNRFTGLQVSPYRVTIHYVVDMAEIPTFQTMPSIDRDGDDHASEDELADYAQGLAPRLLAGVRLTSSGAPVDLSVEWSSAGLGPGQGGLDVLRVQATFVGSLGSGTTKVAYVDHNYGSRIGWKEVVAYGSGGEGIVDATVPTHSVSDALRSYPRDMLSSPLDVTSATVEVAPGASSFTGPSAGPGGVSSPGAIGGSFAELIEKDPSPLFVVSAIFLAMGFGALHALGPGHGKTVMAAYLVGAEGRVRHAVTVGIAVSAMHTTSVVALGLITLWAARLFPPEAVYPWLSLSSGVVVLGLGIWLLTVRLRARAVSRVAHERRAEPGVDELVERAGDYDLALVAHEHGHHHAPPPGASPFSARGLAAVALSGGLLPSPTALVVLLGAVALHRVALGVVLVTAFSVGLAGALTGVGVLVLKARTFASRRLGDRVGLLLPILSAAAIVAVGVVLTTRAAVAL
jgi:nickel/cobalt transporter (NicO) family protein